MADVFLLPATTYQPPPAPSQDRRSGRALNTIMEEEDIDDAPAFADRKIRNNNSHNEKIEAWLSPLSDHFPTPRGFHFLAAPVLPSSPSTYSADETASPATSSNPWNNRSSIMTDSTEFDDLYDDISSEDEDAKRMAPIARKPSLRRQASATARKTSLPPLVIPATRQNTSEPFSGADLKKITSPVPPTPPIKVQLSPEVMTFLHAQQAQEIPTISAPPSLDGSLSSEQMAQMSAPPTPMLAGKDEDRDEDWSGLQLQPNALATLQALSGESDSLDGHELQSEAVIEFPEEPVSEMRQSGLRLITNFAVQPQVSNGTPANHRHSMNGLSALDIPSPGGFFSGLSPRTRTTWHMPTINPDDIAPPTSTTAEEFYRLPWNADKTAPPVPAVPAKPAMPMEEEFYRSSFSSFSATVPVEQIIEVNSQLNDEDDFPTARPIFAQQSTVGSRSGAEPSSPSVEVVPTEIIVDYDPEYARKQQEVALGNLDRTELWLMAQRAYLKPVHGEDEQQLSGLTSIPEAVEEEVKKPAEAEAETADSTTGNKKKTVRFSEMIVTSDVPRQLPSKVYKQESTYYRAFQDYIIRSRAQDVFVHKLPRFESLQAQRVSLREAHRNQLLGKYQLSVVPQSAKKRLSANVARGDDVLVDDFAKLKSEKEAEAMGQMNMSTWHVAAVKMLNGGKLISAPVAKRLGRISRMAPGPHGVARDRARILDLGGQATCDWAWHCAMQYPNTKVYTVTTKAIRQLSNSNIRGPPNHRQVAVDSLTRLPFDDDQFDLVSARELHTMLKFVGENGEDEWESCLKEVMRVLKPGGYIEFSVLDSDIMNAGPLGLAKSVEFGFNLKTLGYDPAPTKSWLGRLGRAGFEDVRRAWTFMPMGERHRGRADIPPPVPLKDSPTGDEVRTHSLEAMVSGSSDHVASICGLVGSWSWERWLLRCEMERVSGELRLVDTVTAGAAMLEADMCLDNVAAIIEEGRDCGAGWRMLTGYARKPRAGMDFIPIFVES